MNVIGKHFSRNASGELTTTLRIAEKFEDYDKNAEMGRGCEGQRCESIYVGTYDCSAIKVGAIIEIFYDRAITTKSGTFQP